ncbi:LysR family transcriptional regulator [Rheinheimera sp.]|uniref:LysR family transcriptional regulator n=1 Tax=Rheinheimera sp. TaxID=1869214 RepID=UPI00307D5964
MDRILQMQIFVRVAELGSFSRAAEQLGLPKTSVSEAVQQLEHSLGSRLLHRTTRRVELSSDGQQFLRRCSELLHELEELQQLFKPGDQQLNGVLRIDMPTGLAKNLVLPKLPAFLQQHPDLQLQLSSTDRRVDLIAEGFDAIVRVGALKDSSLIARPLGQMNQINCVSPAYIQRFGTPTRLDDLGRHQLVNYSQQLSGQKAEFEYQQGTEVKRIRMHSQITVNNTEAYSAACLAGLGLIQLPESGARPYLQSGQMIQVLADFNAPAMPVNLLYAHRKLMSRNLRVFSDWLSQLFQPGAAAAGKST